MDRIVALGQPASNRDEAVGYDVRLGPLAFVCLADNLERTLGEALEVVGSSLSPTDRRPRPLKLVLPVRGARLEGDPAVTGYRLRRQMTQFLENPRWLSEAFLFSFAADPELARWVRIGGGTLPEDDASLVAGDWNLELTDVYAVGTPARHRLGRRLELANRTTGLVPLDTRGLLYSTDHAATAAPTRPLIVPGDVVTPLLTRNRPPSSDVGGPVRGPRRLWRELGGAVDGDVASFLPAEGALPIVQRQYLDLEEPGSVRVWDTSSSSIALGGLTPPYSPAADLTPELYGWERVFGPLQDASARELPLALENGVCRLVFLGRASGQGIALEFWDAGTGTFVRFGRIGAAVDPREVNVVELTGERAVLEWRGGSRALRVILARGWYGPRLEAYNDDPATPAAIEYAIAAGTAITTTPQSPAWVDGIGAGVPQLLWAKGRDADASSAFAAGAGLFLDAAGVRYTATGRALVAQVTDANGPGWTATDLSRVASYDVRSVPVLLSR